MKKFLAVFILSLSLVFSGCKVVNSPAGTPTAYMTVVASNDALATANDSIVTAVTTLNTSAVLTDVQTAAVLNVQKKIAEADIQLTKILNQGPTYAQANVASITALITTIQSAANTLQTQGVIPNTPQAMQISTEINTIVTIATTITSELVTAGIK